MKFPYLTWRHRLLALTSALTSALLGACGGGGGGTPGSAPEISNLIVSPQAVYASAQLQTFSTQFDFFDADGNLASLSLHVRDSLGSTVLDLGTVPIEGIEGLTAGTILGEIAEADVPPDTYTVLVNVTDSTNLVSNTLSTQIRIAAYPWTSQLAGPTAREYAAAALLNGKLYVVGGQLTNTGTVPGPATGIVEVYDPLTNSWSAAPAMPTPRMGLTLTAHEGRLYAMGGRDAGYSISAVNTVEIFDPGTGLWTTGAPMPTARFHAAAALTPSAVGDLIVVAGGETENGVLDTVQAYRPAANDWFALAAMPTARGQLAMAVAGGQLYAVGGYGGLLSQWVSTVEAYDPVLNVWTPRAPMNTPRAHLALVGLDGQLLAAGGENVNRALDVLERYDPVSNTWSIKTPSLPAFTRAAAGLASNRLWVFGNGLTLAYDPANEIR